MKRPPVTRCRYSPQKRNATAPFRAKAEWPPLSYGKIAPVTDWIGNLPSWVSAIAASCALIFTSWTAYNSQRSARASEKQAQLAIEQQRQRDENEKQEQASKVSAWVVGSEGHNGPPTIYLHYVNSSNAPTYTMEITPKANPACKYLIPVVEPTTVVRSVEFTTLTEWMQAEGRKEARANYEGKRVFATTLEALVGTCSSIKTMEVEQAGVTVRFRDTNNTVWRRDPSGALEAESGYFDPFGFRAELPDTTIEKRDGVIEIGR